MVYLLKPVVPVQKNEVISDMFLPFYIFLSALKEIIQMKQVNIYLYWKTHKKIFKPAFLLGW